MSIRVIRTQEGAESWNDEGELKQYEIKYFVIGADSKTAAKDAVFADAPATIEGFKLSSVKFDEYDSDGNCEFTVTYEEDVSRRQQSGDDTTVSFDCGGGTRHITSAIAQTRLWVKPGVRVKNTGNFIGWNGKTGDDMQISGVDVPFAQPRETYTKTMKVSSLTTAFKRKVAALVGCVNSAKWKGWERGEVMFLGCSYSGSTEKEVSVSFNFSIQMNEKGIEIAEGVPPISKEGHVYIWTMQNTQKSQNDLNMDVEAVYAAQVAKYADFAQLGL